MNFIPINRHVLLGDIPQDVVKDKPTILLPEEYTAKISPYAVYEVIQCSSDCSKLNVEDIGKLVVVNQSMVEVVSVDQGEFLLILENHLYGVLED